MLGLPLLLRDERWSTVAAGRFAIAQDMSRAKRAEKIDAHAAARILQGAIDALTRAADADPARGLGLSRRRQSRGFRGLRP